MPTLVLLLVDDTVDRVARIRLGGDERLVAAGGQRLVAVAAGGRRLVAVAAVKRRLVAAVGVGPRFRVRDRRDRFVACKGIVVLLLQQLQNLSHFGVQILGRMKAVACPITSNVPYDMQQLCRYAQQLRELSQQLRN